MNKIAYFVKKAVLKINRDVISLSAYGTQRGNTLISYTTLPFISPELMGGHTNRWECWRIAETWRERGYAVDVIDFENTHFVPRKKYDFFLDIHNNMERLAPYLGKDCVKILHLTTAHWLFNNTAEYRRLSDLASRRNVVLLPERLLPPNRAVETADMLLFLLGNETIKNTYTYAKKTMRHVPISTTYEYPLLENKDFDKTRKHFVWIGGAGLVHKGVDLLLEAFSSTPHHTITLCGKINDIAFKEVYRRELSMSNITVAGMLDLGGEVFSKIRSENAFIISPSCAEGQSGAVIVGMHAGLIPIVSKESGIDTHDFGVTLKENTVKEICKTIEEISSLPPEILQEMSYKAWTYARKHHTRKKFTEAHNEFVDKLLQRI